MTRLAELLGSITRASVVEALAFGKKPLSAYRIARMYNLNIPKVYLEIKRLSKMGLVTALQGRKGIEYTLNDESIRTLATKLGSRTILYSEWRAQKNQLLRDGLLKVPRFSISSPREPVTNFEKTTRLRGELDTLALLARKKFDKKYCQIGDRVYARV